MMPPTKDPDLLGPAYLGQVYADAVADADVTRAWLVPVVHPKVNGASAGSEVLLWRRSVIDGSGGLSIEE